MSPSAGSVHPLRNAVLLALVAAVALAGGFLVRPLVIEEQPRAAAREATEAEAAPAPLFGSDASRLVGVWELVSWQRRGEGGEVTWPYGEDAVGRLIYSTDGQMSAQLMRRDREPGREGGFFSYAGSWSLDEATGLVTHRVVLASDPSWVGSEQRRRYRFESDDRLELRVEERGDRLVWARTE